MPLASLNEPHSEGFMISILFGHAPSDLRRTAASRDHGAAAFGCSVHGPERYGVAKRIPTSFRYRGPHR